MMKVYMVQVCTVLCSKCIEDMRMSVDDIVKFDAVDAPCAKCGRTA